MRNSLIALTFCSTLSAAARAGPAAPPLDPPAPLEASTVGGTASDAAGAVESIGDPAGDPPPIDGGIVDEPAAPRELVRLSYTPGVWAAVCPGIDDIKARVRAHLGYDAFGEPAARVILLMLDGADEAAPARARIELLDPLLRSLGSRVIEANDGCEDLVATAALQISIALDPLAAPLHGTPSTTPPTPTPTPPRAVPTQSRSFARPSPADAPVRFIASVDGHSSLLLARGGPMFGMAVGAGARGALWSMRGEFRADFAGDEDDNAGVTAFPLLLSAVPCAHLPLGADGGDGVFELVGCATVTGGIMPVIGTVEGVGIYVGSGARVGFDWHFNDDTVLRVFTQLEAAILRASWTSGSYAFSDAPVNLMIGIGGDIGDW